MFGKGLVVLCLFGMAYSMPQFLAHPGVAFHHAPVAKVHAAPVAFAQPAFHHAPAVVAHHAPLVHAAPVLAKAVAPAVIAKTVVADDFDHNPQYSYGYSVQDGITGDAKGHQETRNGDVVQGQYQVVEPDGSLRTVTYTADPVHGFNAVVERTAAGAPVVAKAVAPVAVKALHAAPVLKFH